MLLRALLLLVLLASFSCEAASWRERWQQRHAIPSSPPAASSPATTASSMQVFKDLPYGKEMREVLDVYQPAAAAHAPIIVMVHGGAWRTGDKAMSRVTRNKLDRWVNLGIILVSVNYPMLPQTDPLSQSQSVARALAFVQQHAGDWGGDGSKVILMGHSAGAHLISLLAANPQQAYEQGAKPWLGSVSLDSAAMDLVQTMQSRHYGFYDPAFGTDPTYWRATSPLHQLTSKATPLLLVCSSQRPDHPCGQAQQMADQARQLGVRAELLPQALAHSAINEQLGLPGPYTSAVENFLRSLDPALQKILVLP